MSRPAAAYEFGDYRLDPLSRVVSLRDRPLPLAPKSFDLLRLMVERRGRLLERNELIRELWPDTIVEEANLTFQVSTLRKALGEDGSKWIETVPKHGYRFTAPVREVREATAAPEAAEVREAAPLAAPAPRPRPIRIFVIVAAAAALLTALAWVWRAPSDGPQPRPSPQPRASTAAPLTSYQGWEGTPALSPDASQVAFSWEGADRDAIDIYVKLVGPGEPHRLTTSPGMDMHAAWSPDGRQIAFVRRSPKSPHLAVYVIPALGGAERRLTEFAAADVDNVPGNILAWTPDSKSLAVACRFDEDAPSEVWMLAADSGERRRLTSAGDGQIGDYGVSFSPDGRFLALLRYATRSVGDLYLLPLGAGYTANGALVQLTHERRLVGGPAWNARGDRIYYSTGGGALSYRTLRAIDIDPDHPERRFESAPLHAGEHATALSSAGDRLVYARAQRDTNIWRLALPGTSPGAAGGGAAAKPTPTVAFSSTFDEHNPDFSADGQRITFTSTRSGSEEIWVVNADGSGAAQMTSMGGANTSNSRWSPDGRTILFNSRRTGSSDLYLVDVATRDIRRLTDDPGDEYESRWSRDGQSIYFVSDRTGRAETWKMPAAGGPAVQMTRHGGTAAFESADGRWLYFGKEPRPMSIWRMPIGGGEETKVLDDLSYNFNFVVTARGIYLVTFRDGVSSIEFFDFAARRTKVLHTLDRPFWFGLAVAPDERSLLFSKIDSGSSDLMVVEHLQ